MGELTACNLPCEPMLPFHINHVERKRGNFHRSQSRRREKGACWSQHCRGRDYQRQGRAIDLLEDERKTSFTTEIT